jgi:N-acetylneuraminate synthase
MRLPNSIFSADPASPYVIAEVAQAHDGSLGLAHAFIDAVSRTGADAIKFQTHLAEAESTERETFRVPFSYADATRFAYWKRTGFTEEQWVGIKRHAEEKGLTFLSSPFSLEAAQLLQKLGVEAWKIGSGELDSLRMVEFMAATGKPLILSTGMSSMEEVDAIVARMTTLANGRFALMQCTTAYPTPPEAVGLNVFAEYQERYGCPVGLSDHTGTPWAAVIGAWLGAKLIEVHVTLSSDMFGPDVSSSLTIDGLTSLIEGVRFAHSMRCNPLDKDAMATAKAPLKRLFGKSAVASRDLSPGDIVDEAAVAFRKPGDGISEKEFSPLIGRRLRRAIGYNEPFNKEDFEP